MKYQAVIFDLFGTLVPNLALVENESTLRRMASVLSVSPDDFARLWTDTYDARMNGVFHGYQATIEYICQQIGGTLADSQIELAAQIRFDVTKREITSPRADAIEVLSYLKSKGYKTGLISNCSADAIAVWKDAPLAPFIDVVVFSCSVGLMKPDPRIYQLAVEQLVVKPENCLYIADGIGQELKGASQVGMHPVLIRVHDEDSDDPYREEWHGPTISSLKDVLTLVE